MANTENLGLTLTGSSQEELAMSFLAWRRLINGEGNNSNMEKLDAAYALLLGMFGGLKFEIDQNDDGVNIIYAE